MADCQNAARGSWTWRRPDGNALRRACEEMNALILRSRAQHGVLRLSKDEGWPRVPAACILRDAAVEIGCCGFRHSMLPKSGKPDFGCRSSGLGEIISHT